MTLMRVFSRVDDEGRILIPKNVQRETGLKPGQLVEIKVTGVRDAQNIVVHKRKAVR